LFVNPPFVADPLNFSAEDDRKALVPVLFHKKHYELAKSADDKGDLSEFLKTDLSVTRITDVYGRLWAAGRKMPPRPLHRQVMMRRDIIPSSQCDLHLTWSGRQMFIKPLPKYMLNKKFWQENICGHEDLYKSALGFLLSYAQLITNELDFHIAVDDSKHPPLIPPEFTYQTWRSFIADLLTNISIDDLTPCRNPRYNYGELRLQRLNWIYRLSWNRVGLRHAIRGYRFEYQEYSSLIARNFAWLIAAFAYVTVVLGAMEVGLSTDRLSGNSRFQDASYGFAVFSIIAPLIAVALIATIVLLILVQGIFATWKHHREERKKKQKRVATIKESAA
jgi:uncharacterized membrane protein